MENEIKSLRPYVLKGEIDGLNFKISKKVKMIFANGFIIEFTPSDEVLHGFNPTLVPGWPEMEKKINKFSKSLDVNRF